MPGANLWFESKDDAIYVAKWAIENGLIDFVITPITPKEKAGLASLRRKAVIESREVGAWQEERNKRLAQEEEA